MIRLVALLAIACATAPRAPLSNRAMPPSLVPVVPRQWMGELGCSGFNIWAGPAFYTLGGCWRVRP